MYAFNTHPTFEARVDVTLLDGSPQGDFRVRFVSLPIDEYESFDIETAEGAAAFVRRVLVDAWDVTDLDDRPIVFCDAVRERFINIAFLRRSLIVAYHEAQRGN